MSEIMTEYDKSQEPKRQLEWELSLAATEIVSHGWYHGPLERAAAEVLLPHDGSFLVRDSTTQPGHYVLSCRQGTHFLHFVINRVVIQPDTVYEHFQYQFESEAYDTVPDLVRSYVGSGKPISMASGARIQTPSNRTAPLLCYPSGITRTGTVTKSFSLNNPPWKLATSYGASSHINVPCKSNSSCSSPNVNYSFETHTLTSSLHKVTSTQVANHTANETLCSLKNNCSCCSFNECQTANHTAIESSWNPSSGMIHPTSKSRSFGEQAALLDNTYNAFTAQCNAAENTFNYKKQRSLSLSPAEIMQISYQKSSSADGVIQNTMDAKKLSMIKSDSIKDDSKLELWESVAGDSPPAKPARTPAPAYQASGSDSGNGSGDSAQSSAPGEPPASVDLLRTASKPMKRRLDVAYAEELLMKSQILEFKQMSIFDTEAFESELLSSQDNKPLESDTLQTIKLLLRTSGPMILATHLTKVDLKLILSPITAGDNSNPLEKVSGLELCLLAHGEQMRLDIIERVECIKFLIVVTILTCQNDAERADVLNDWIQLAIETKTALGNLFGFSAIMLGLCTKQVECMEGMWNILRQKHTYAAFTFEAKLRPCFKNMNDCVDSSPPNTTLPHILPAVTLLLHGGGGAEQYAVNTADYGLSVLSAQLEAARRFPGHLAHYERNARVAISTGPHQPHLQDLFRTEFHVKFLWGARGALSPRAERHSRLADILATMADRYLTPPAIK
ncbi:SH2 domain-containing protein 3C [Arctopsyche grandis]|uniref:SH2 domain-containing protein 3C n=1 Tax=Arctopsyche grandis TaxID=121162 RepID=UPI00406D9361